MVEVLKKEYWSRSDAFLLPLTGLSKNDKFELKSYLFWNEYSILDYKLTLTFDCEEYESFLEYCRKYVFPVLDRKGYLVENYDVQGRSIFVLDLSEWALDIELFMSGKYSKMSKEAKTMIERFHTFSGNKIPIHVYAVLYPNTPMVLLDGLSPIEYVCQKYTYGLPLEEIRKIGEIGSTYDELPESLLTDVVELCKDVI